MKPQKYLTKEAKQIFEEIRDHLSSVECHDVDSFKLSILASAFDDYAKFSEKIAEEGVTNKHDQKHPLLSARDSAVNTITKFSSAFGIDPQSREKIAAFAEKKTKLPDLS